MRGSALRAPRGLGGGTAPVHPRQREALLPCAIPASELSGPDTSGPRVRPLENRAQVALLPETPARKGLVPFSPYPALRCQP
jgi:hypothetical protein